MKKKKSDTLFILGTGPSINDLTEIDWKDIALHDSIGLNYWLYHPFVPTFYHFETFKSPFKEGSDETYYSHLLKWLDRKRDYRNVCWFFNRTLLVKEAGLSIREVAAHVYRFGIRADSFLYKGVSGFEKACQSLDPTAFAKTAQALSDPHIHPKAASLGVVLSIAFTMGYKQIVLLGVDLTDPRYFWSEWDLPDVHLRVNPGSQTHGTHKTLTDTFGLPIDRFVDAYDKFVLKPAGVTLWIGSEKSALYPRLPLYPFPSTGKEKEPRLAHEG